MKNLIKKLKEYGGLFLLLLAVIIALFAPSVYWFVNDHLTQIQVFKQLWYIYPIIFLLLGGAIFLLKDEKRF